MAIATCCCKVYFAQGPNLQISIPFPEHSYYLCCLIVFSFAYDHSQPFRDSLVSPSLSCAKRTNIYTSTLFYLFPHEYDIPFFFFLFNFVFLIPRSIHFQVAGFLLILPSWPGQFVVHVTPPAWMSSLTFWPCSSLITLPRFLCQLFCI